MSAMAWLDKGGVVMWVLVAVSVYALGVVLFKLWQFVTHGVLMRQPVDAIIARMKAGKRAEAKDELARSKGPLARIMLVSLECVEDRKMQTKYKEAEIMRVGAADLHHLESHLRGLEMAATVAPLLGLLGTVIGLIDSFSKLGIGSARVDPTMLAGGIWAALLTTAAGLIVAIPALAAHGWLDSVLEKLRVHMKDASVQILALEEQATEPVVVKGKVA